MYFHQIELIISFRTQWIYTYLRTPIRYYSYTIICFLLSPQYIFFHVDINTIVSELRKFNKFYTHTHTHTYIYIYIHQPVHWYKGKSVSLWTGRPGFSHRLSHTKDSKNGTYCLQAKPVSIIRHESRARGAI